ncbi:sphingomyelin phosphodiesterase 3-like [Schistocerca americana]|uniref:sphingomyelin phosphodiesterase 3-like n=1 Tax=Schistocerca americana TaxID=7009 RepID=UPI001F4FA32F|nr:sphingomyelin phosphodiesterase 3-like [Schistocerca americana]
MEECDCSEKHLDDAKDDTPELQYRLDIATRYYSKNADLLDTISYNLMLPWVTLLSLLLSCCVVRESAARSVEDKIMNIIMGSIYLLLVIVVSPVGVIGIVLWLIICRNFKQEKYTYVEVNSDCESAFISKRNENKYFTFGSANVLLAPEFVCRLNNVTDSKTRAAAIAEIFTNHTGKHLHNLDQEDAGYEVCSKLESLHSEVPYTDFLCLQEVWERSYALILIDRLKDEFKYFLYDVGEYSWDINHCMLGSGLMFASKKPILAADFKTFSYRTKHAKYTSQGVLCVKVLLSDSGLYRHVGFISNMHTQAFQGDEPVIPRQVTDAYVFIHMFKYKFTEKTDIVDFDVICGDFNADNMSPADEDFQYHVIFKEYCDVCVEKPGKDHDWAIGTEMRQMTMHSEELSDPEIFKEILADDSERRRFLLDADVIVHGHHLRMAVANRDKDGLIRPVPWGGMRRIDRILFNKTISGSVPVGYCFSTALTNLTDHLPIYMTLTNKHCMETKTL